MYTAPWFWTHQKKRGGGLLPWCAPSIPDHEYSPAHHNRAPTQPSLVFLDGNGWTQPRKVILGGVADCCQSRNLTYTIARPVARLGFTIEKECSYMENLGTLVIASFLAVMLGCSNGGGGSPTSGGSSADGASASGGGGAGGTTAAAGGNGSDSCPLPICLRTLATECAESGDCTTQTDLSTDNWNTCYANGITEKVITDTSTSGRTVTVKKGSAICFSTAFNQSDVIAGTGAVTVTNASGTKVASVKVDASTSLYKVTCTGGQEVVLDQSCLNVYPVSALMGSGCQEGACTP
jgi:hypothetical protein